MSSKARRYVKRNAAVQRFEVLANAQWPQLFDRRDYKPLAMKIHEQLAEAVPSAPRHIVKRFLSESERAWTLELMAKRDANKQEVQNAAS